MSWRESIELFTQIEVQRKMSDLAYSARKFTYSVFEAVYKMSIIENTPCDDKYSVIDLAH